MVVIGIVGRMRHGKDTIGDFLVNSYKFKKLSFAQPLKEACRTVFGFNNDQLYGDSKEVEDEFWKVTPRKVLQYIGTDLFRDQLGEIIPGLGQDIWVKAAQKKILDNPNQDFVICDVRFLNEVQMIKDSGGIIFKVVRPSMSMCSNHVSERMADEFKDYNHLIINDGTLNDLYKKVDEIAINELL